MRSPRAGGASFLRMTARGPGLGDALASNGATECAPIHQILLRNDTSADLADPAARLARMILRVRCGRNRPP
jgi:hypothetical protein